MKKGDHRWRPGTSLGISWTMEWCSKCKCRKTKHNLRCPGTITWRDIEHYDTSFIFRNERPKGLDHSQG